MTPQTQAWKMKIAILGSTGFLGKVLLEKALNAGYQVSTLVRNQGYPIVPSGASKDCETQDPVPSRRC